jgi:hypothetical protein
MRRFAWAVSVAVLLAMSGCGGSEQVGKPETLTDEEIREMDRVQEEVDAAERQERGLNP